MKRCILDPTRIERCLICPGKCRGFFEWYQHNRCQYDSMVDQYITKFPDKYEKGVDIIMTTSEKGKLVLVLDKDSKVVETTNMDKIKSDPNNADKYSGYRLIECTGSEYEVVLTVHYKKKPLDRIKGAKSLSVKQS